MATSRKKCASCRSKEQMQESPPCRGERNRLQGVGSILTATSARGYSESRLPIPVPGTTSRRLFHRR
eukprot:6173326-Pleurochrysis_carterae.AAC.2